MQRICCFGMDIMRGLKVSHAFSQTRTRAIDLRFYCKRCFGRFTVQSALDNHKMFCTAMDACQQIYTMPPEGSKLKFRNVRHQARFPFVIYADFEALTVPCTRTNSDTELANCYQQHEPISVGLKLVSTVPGVLELPYESHMGADVAVWLLNRLLAYRIMTHEYLFDPKRLVMTVANQAEFESAFVCYICGKRVPRRVHEHEAFSCIKSVTTII